MHYGKFLGLDKEADGMVTIEAQRLPEKYVSEVVELKATHPTVANDAISFFLKFSCDFNSHSL